MHRLAPGRATIPALPLTLALFCVCAGSFGAAYASGTAARFKTPLLDRPVFGKVTIEVEVETPPEIVPLKIEIFVDGRQIGTALDPPFRAEWDSGDGADAHTLRARAYTSDGGVTTIEARTIPRIGMERARVLLVEVYATVKSAAGRFINDLDAPSFTLGEDGVTQKLSLVARERRPVQVVLLLDVSASMKKEERLTSAIEAARLFVGALDPNDRVAVVAFSDTVRVLQPFTGDIPRVLDAIGTVAPERGTALYDAIYASADLLGKEEGRKALVLLSDGQDNSYDGMSPGSARTLEEAIEEALRQQVTTFTIGLGENLRNDFDFNHRHSAQEVLTRLSADTGGQFIPVARPGRLRGAFERVLDELRFQYTLGYHPTNDRRDGSWRSITVKVDRPHSVVTARKGYFAPTD